MSTDGGPPRRSIYPFLAGLGIGAIPLAIGLGGLGGYVNYHVSGLNYPAVTANTFFASGCLGVVGLVAAIILISQNPDTPARRVGQGMLAALLASPIIYYIGCMVVNSANHGSST
ncbi:MAG TPA: hypothetical protein VF808_15025 [Ktedonobacterales bacterium]